MRKSCALLLISLLLVGPVLAADTDAREKPHSIQWQDYHQAMADSRDHHKPVLLHFTAGASKWSKKMQTETYSDPDVIAYLDAHFATGWVDTERFQKLARQYEVNALPTLWFLDTNGKGLTVIDGYTPPGKLLSVLQFIQTESYRDMSFEQWSDQLKGRRR